MKKKLKLQRLLKALSPDVTKVDFSAFDSSVANLKSALEQKIQVATVDDVKNQLEKFKSNLNLRPILDSVDTIKKSFDEEIQKIVGALDVKTEELNQSKQNKTDTTELNNEVADLHTQLDDLETKRKGDLIKLRKSIPDLTDLENRVGELTLEVTSRLDILEEPEDIIDWQAKIDIFRTELLKRIESIGGGSMNRHINFNGTDFLTKYTDINYKAGTNVTFTVVNNNATKMVDVTISATGGGGGGTVRVITSVSTPTTAASASQTDYVYLVSGTTTITMPDATASNTNLYTIKNVGSGVVTISTTSAQTIDGSATIVMPVQYTSVDLISNTANWNIT